MSSITTKQNTPSFQELVLIQCWNLVPAHAYKDADQKWGTVTLPFSILGFRDNPMFQIHCVVEGDRKHRQGDLQIGKGAFIQIDWSDTQAAPTVKTDCKGLKR